jgi:hypothetical protein
VLFLVVLRTMTLIKNQNMKKAGTTAHHHDSNKIIL